MQDSLLYSYRDSSFVSATSINNISSIDEPSCYPNPFNPSTNIRVKLLRDEWLNVTVFNAKGEKVSVITDKAYSKGSHNIQWNARTLCGQTVATGSYLVQISTSRYTYYKKIDLLK